MKSFADKVSSDLSAAIVAGVNEPEIVERFTLGIAKLSGPTKNGSISIRSKFIHQRPYALLALQSLQEKQKLSLAT